jgi:hypothetical protein
MASTSNARPLGDVPDAFIGLLQAQMKWSQQLFEDFTGTKAPDFTQTWNAWQRGWQQPMKPPMPACHVPPPCWMPSQLCDVVSRACGCGTVTIRLVVTNCDRAPRVYSVRTDGVAGVTVTPATLTINPLRRGSFDVSFQVPDKTEPGAEFETLVWLEGCRQHVLRWTIQAVRSGCSDSTHEITVDDCPDFRHHWYDHFYCNRPCPTPRRQANG